MTRPFATSDRTARLVTHGAMRGGTWVSGVALALALAGTASAQSSPGGFSLPTPTPSPTSAPQGPADERAGVPIGPRVIRPVRSTPTPTPTPAAPVQEAAPAESAPAETATTQPAPATTTSQPARSAPTQSAPARTSSAPTTRRSTITQPTFSDPIVSDTRNSGASGAEISLGSGSGVAPGFESLPPVGEENAAVGPDGWYDVDPSGARTDPGTVGTGPSTVAPATGFDPLDAWSTAQTRMMIGVALMALILIALLVVMARRKRRESAVQGVPNEKLTAGIRTTMNNQMPSILQDAPDWAKGESKAAAKAEPKPEPKPEAEKAVEDPAPDLPVAPEPEPQPEPEASPEPEPEPEPEPAHTASPEPAPVMAPVFAEDDEDSRLDVELEIVSASRSLMMFTVDFRLDLANRSDKAVRDLTVAGKLACAQAGGANAAPIASGQPLGKIERIGPQQSGRIAGQLQLPLAEVQAIRQGAKPLFIPLLHVTLEGKGRPAMSQSFVLGTPSAANTGRVHPLPLDGPPGSLPSLRAQLIKQPVSA